MPRALVTGVTGQDGSYLSELLLDQGYEVVGMVRSPIRLDGVRTVHGDLADAASLRAAVLETAPDELYHLAAPTFVPASWNDPAGTLALVAGATGTLLTAAHEAGEAPALALRSRQARRLRPRRHAARRARPARQQRDRLQPRVAAPPGALPAAQGHAGRRRDQARAA